MIEKVLRGCVGLLMIVGVVACSSSAKKSDKSTTTSSGAIPATVTASDALQFAPSTLTVNVGQTVTWTNGGSIGHTVTFDNGPAFSQPLNSGATVTRTFTAAGTFAYHCNIHGQSMHGTIIVK